MIDKLKTLLIELNYQRGEFLNAPNKVKTVGCEGMVKEYDKMLTIVRELIKEQQKVEERPQKPYTLLDVMYMSGVREVFGRVKGISNGKTGPFEGFIKCVTSMELCDDLSELLFNRLIIRNGHADIESDWKTSDEFYV